MAITGSPDGRAGRRSLCGVLPIVHLPFDEADQIDEADLRREIDWIFSVGADGLGTGMVSEVTRLSADERARLGERLVEFAAGRGSVFMSVGAESGRVARSHAVAAERAGCDAVMAVPPMTVRLPPAAVVDYFRGIAGTMPGVDLLDGVVALWRALSAGDEETTYAISLPLSAIVALQMQAGLDGFLAIEKYLLVKRGLFRSDRRREPNGWSLDSETAREVDRLFERLAEAIAATCATRS